MNKSQMAVLFPIGAAAIFVALDVVASAQTDVARQIEARLSAAVEKIQTACGEDLKKFCSTVTPGEGRLLLCIQAHEDKISTKCDYALFDAARKLDRGLDRLEEVADACWNDIEKLCSNVPEGGGRIAQCLVSRKTSLTSACQAGLGKFQADK